jgi:hypothetical protein
MKLTKRHLRQNAEIKHASHFVVIPYQDHWQWLFGIECALTYSHQGNKVEILSLDYFNRNYMKRKLLALFGYQSINPAILKLLDDYSLTIINLNFLQVIKAQVLAFLQFYVRKSNDFDSVITPHLAGTLKSLDFNSSKAKRTRNNLVRETLSTLELLKTQNYDCAKVVVTPSGRYVRNRAVKYYFNNNKYVQTFFVDSVSSNRYSIMNDPQSIEEGVKRYTEHWNNEKSNFKFEVAHNYFEERLSRVKTSVDLWTAQMKDGLLPEYTEKKKLCVFYTTTQIEFVGTEGQFPEGVFASQVDAIRAVRQKLHQSEWEVIIRRHPKQLGHSNEDDDLMEGLYEIPGIQVIEGNSPVDSYELGKRADLILHFGSHIGAEFIFMQTAPVYSMHRDPWWRFDEEHHLFEIERWNKLDLENLTMANPGSVLPFAYFLMTGGETFKHVSHIDSLGWTLNGTPIHIPLSKWIIGRRESLLSTLKKS